MGRVELKLRPEEFWGLTFHLFFTLYERYSEMERRQDIRAGVICAVLANIHRNKKTRKAFTPGDFFPSLKEEKKEMSWQEQLEYIKHLQAMMSGKKK